VTPTKHRADDRLLLDGRPRSVNRRRRRDRSKAAKPKADPLQAVRDRQAREASWSLPKTGVDPFATVALKDRPMTPEQRSELSAMSRDPFLNFKYPPALTRGEADRLIPWLRREAKKRRREQQKTGKKLR
jgi:hypothetical protein